MKVIIAGSRNISDYKLVVDTIQSSGYEITEVVSGTAVGPDQLGEQAIIGISLSILPIFHLVSAKLGSTVLLPRTRAISSMP